MRLKKKPEPDDDAAPEETEVRARALGLLARREHSVLELERKLRQRGYEHELIDPVLKALCAEGLLSETRFAEAWLHSRAARGYGPVKIRAELRLRGLTDLQVQQALAGADTDWGKSAAEVRRKRFGAEQPGSLPERARQTRFLESRGFTGEHIRQALRGEPDD